MDFVRAVALTTLGLLAYLVIATAVSVVVLHIKERRDDREFDKRVERRQALLSRLP